MIVMLIKKRRKSSKHMDMEGQAHPVPPLSWDQ